MLFTQVWSCGGGTQSAAIAVLIIQGRLPKPDRAIIVDTERENSSTWTYMDAYLRPELAKVGVELERVAKWGYATVDLYRNDDILLPMFTEKGKLPTFCSNEWKQRVLKRHLRASADEGPYKIWLGMSMDELRRVRVSNEWRYQNRFPLVYDVPLNRAQCEDIVVKHGWAKPPRSSCWMCPNKGDAEWLEEKRERPEDFAKAVELERQIRAKDAGLYLHKSRVPLDQANFVEAEGESDGCQTSFCFN